jgi:hypothetical protein
MDQLLPVGLAPTALRLGGIGPDEFEAACPGASHATLMVRRGRGAMFAIGGQVAEIWQAMDACDWTALRVLYAGADAGYALDLARALGALQGAGVASVETAVMVLRLHALRQAGAVLPGMDSLAVTSSVPVPVLEGCSEAAVHAHSLRVRAAEDRPPTFQRHPIGTIVRYYAEAGRPQEYLEVREYALDDPRLGKLSETPVRDTVEKYAAWTRARSLPPPIRLYETVGGRLSIGDGHHRLAAARLAGQTTITAKVHPTWVARLENDEPFPYDINAETVDAWAESIRPWPAVMAQDLAGVPA